MAKIGNWGRYLRFQTSDRRILTFRDASDEYYSTDHEICEECQTALYKWWSEGKKEEI